MAKKNKPQYELNKTIHEPARLLILTFLASSPENECSFTELRDHLQMTSGNLSIQLKNLQNAGLILIKKKFEDNKPLTTVEITQEGANNLMDYFDEMERLIVSVRQESNRNTED